MKVTENVIFEDKNKTITMYALDMEDGHGVNITKTIENDITNYTAILWYASENGRQIGNCYAVWSTDESRSAWSTFSNINSNWQEGKEIFEVYQYLGISIPTFEEITKKLCDENGNISYVNLIQNKRHATYKLH